MEMALVAPLLMFLLFSIIEFGFLVKNQAELGQAAREGARLAAVGSTPTQITSGIQAACTTIMQERLTSSYQFRAWDESAQNWGSWQTLGVADGSNNAENGDQIQIQLTYDHQLLVPGLMGPVLNADESGCVSLQATSVMMRE